MEHHFHRREESEHIGRPRGVHLGRGKRVETGAIQPRPGSVTTIDTTVVCFGDTGSKTYPDTYSIISRWPAGTLHWLVLALPQSKPPVCSSKWVAFRVLQLPRFLQWRRI